LRKKYECYLTYDPDYKSWAQADYAKYFSREYGEPIERPQNIRIILLEEFQKYYPQSNLDMFVEWFENAHDNGILDVLLLAKNKIYIDEWAFYHWVNGWPYPYNAPSKFRIDRGTHDNLYPE